MNKRSKAKPEPTPTPPEAREGYRQTLHLGLDTTDIGNLDMIAEHMRSDPIIGRLHNNIGREKAARYAIAQYAKATGAKNHSTTG